MDPSYVPIVVAIVTVFGSIIGNLIANYKTKKERIVSEAVEKKELENRLDRIEEKINQHNGYAEKFTDIFNLVTEQGKDIEYIKGILSGNMSVR